MNSSAPSQSNATASDDECHIYTFLGGKLDHTTPEAYAVLVVLIIIGIITSPITILLNALVMAAVGMKPRLKTMSNIALACLAATDGLMGVIGMPLFIAGRIFILEGATSREFCTLQRTSRYSLRILGGATVLHLVLMNVERYLAIKHSFKYANLVTGARVLRSSGIAWVATLLLTIPLTLLDENIYLRVNNFVLFLCTAIIVFCQVAAYLETRRHEKQIAAHQVSVQARQKFLKEKKAFKLTTILLLTQLATYSPIFFVRILLTKSVIRSKNTAFIAFYLATFILIMSSLINPIIYCVRARQFRVAFFEILLRKKKNSEAAGNQNMRFSARSLNTVAPLGEKQERKENQHNEKGNLNSSKQQKWMQQQWQQQQQQFHLHLHAESSA